MAADTMTKDIGDENAEAPSEREREIIELAAALVRLPTENPPGAELQAALIVKRFLDDSGLEIDLQSVSGDRANLIARLRGRGQSPALVFSGHLDTVPVGPDDWTDPPHDGMVRDGRLYGRGSADMKGAVAAMAVVMRDLSRSGVTPNGDIVLALTVGEEVDCIGARTMVDSGVLDDMGMLVVGEMTGLDVGCAHKGLLWVTVETKGARGHGATAQRGDNAIANLIDWLQPVSEIEGLVSGQHPLLGKGSLSLNQLAGGDAPNVVPAYARAVLDIRTLPGHDHAAILSALQARNPEVTVTLLREGQPVATPVNAKLIRTTAEIVTDVLGRPAAVRGLSYLTDASVLVGGRDIPTVIVGPGTEANAHAVDECVEVLSLFQAARIYQRIAEQMIF